jgi:hypothetical protein
MKLTSIRASAGCTIPHPHESYSNFKLFVELTADLKPGEDPVAATTTLQATVNTLLANEKTRRIEDIECQYAEARARREAEHEKMRAIQEAEYAVREAEEKLERLRSGEAETDEIPF